MITGSRKSYWSKQGQLRYYSVYFVGLHDKASHTPNKFVSIQRRAKNRRMYRPDLKDEDSKNHPNVRHDKKLNEHNLLTCGDDVPYAI